MTATIRKLRNDSLVEIAVDAAIEVDAGDLVYLNVDDARPFGSVADQGTEALNQEYAARRFVGPCVRGKQGTAAAGTVLVDADPNGTWRYPCPSTTWEVGELVGPSENGDGDALLPQQVEKVTDIALAIGVCTKKATSATTVEFKAFPKVGSIRSLLKGVALLAAAVAGSTAVTASATATTFSTGSRVVDGALLKAGDLLRIKAAGTLTSTGSETVTVEILVGTEVVATTGAVNPADSGDIFRLEADVAIRTAGASGKLQAHGTVALGTPGTVTAKPFCSTELSEDISSSALAVTCRVTNSSTGESVVLQAFTVEHVQAAA